MKYPSSIPELKPVHQGKVRDTFQVPDRPELLLVVATDRISTHNVVHKSVIPGKGTFLTQMTIFWMTEILGVPNHLIAWGKDIYKYIPIDIDLPEGIHERAVIVKKLEMIPIEFIFRDFMAGSLWNDYRYGRPNPYGLEIPGGLQLMSRFQGTVFTPTDKSED